jgi:hypothetical protein
MKNNILITLVFTLFSLPLFSQKYFTKKAHVSFYSKAEKENIEAHNKRGASIFDLETGQFEFSVLIRSFEFEKALMQEHFNEEYMESHKYPKAVFKGNILDFQNLDFSREGTIPVKIKGDLTMHGETNTIEVSGEFVVKNGEISAYSNFDVALKDYQIKVPSLVTQNIAEIITIKIAIENYEPFKK